MTEKIFKEQTNYGWGLTFNLTGKAPAINKRIFDKLTDAQSYCDDFNDSAVEGILLSVVGDNEKNNGVYFVQTIKTHENDASAQLIKLSFGDLEEAQNYINKKIKELQTQHQSDITNILNTLGEVSEGNTIVDIINSVAEANVNNKTEIDNYTINEKVISTNPVLNTDDLKISNNYSTSNGKIEDIIPDDIITKAFSKLEIALAQTSLALTAAINDLEKRIGTPTQYDENNNVIKEGTGLMKRVEQLEKNM